MFKNQTHYSIARFDGALMYDDLRAGLMATGITKSPIVHFKIQAGIQQHPAWAIDELAIEIYCYCRAAQEVRVSPTHLQVSIAATWISAESYSNLIVTNVEWHIASNELRKNALRMYSDFTKRRGLPAGWPDDIITIPVVVK